MRVNQRFLQNTLEQTVVFLVGLLGLAIYLALVESSYAKLRLFRVPQYLGVGFVCALMALALRNAGLLGEELLRGGR